MKKYNIWDSTTDKAQRIKFIYILCYGHLFIKYEPKELKKRWVNFGFRQQNCWTIAHPSIPFLYKSIKQEVCSCQIQR